LHSVIILGYRGKMRVLDKNWITFKFWGFCRQASQPASKPYLFKSYRKV